MDQYNFKVGDTVKVQTRDLENQKLSKAPFEGVVISVRGEGENKTFCVRKNASWKVAVERIFPLNSPTILAIAVVRKGDVRRAKLYYLRKS